MSAADPDAAVQLPLFGAEGEPPKPPPPPGWAWRPDYRGRLGLEREDVPDELRWWAAGPFEALPTAPAPDPELLALAVRLRQADGR